MITIVDGDLLDATEDIIGHQVNAQSVMGSGIAKQIRAKYPNVYDEYMKFCDKYPLDLLGNCQFVSIGEPDENSRVDKYVANLFGQLNYGRTAKVYTNYNALRQALERLKAVAQYNNLSVALPYLIGCGYANGDWNIVYPMLEEVFSDYNLKLYRYKE